MSVTIPIKMLNRSTPIPLRVPRLAHGDAWRVFERALEERRDGTIILDMSGVHDATTSAFARFVLLRRELLRRGRDLRLRNLHGRAAMLYEISRLDSVLPQC